MIVREGLLELESFFILILFLFLEINIFGLPTSEDFVVSDPGSDPIIVIWLAQNYSTFTLSKLFLQKPGLN